MSITTGKVEFTKHEFQENTPLDANLQYRGAFAITRDKEYRSLMHKAFTLAQYVLNLLFNLNLETDYCHSMIVLDQPKAEDEKKKDQLVVSHVICGGGLKTTRVNYLNYEDKDVTSLAVYIPKDERLRALIAKHGLQTTYVPDKHREALGDTTVDKKPVDMAAWKVLLRWFRPHSLREKPPECDQRIARIAADLLMGKQLLNEQGDECEAHYCLSYSASILQGSIIIRGLEEENQDLSTFMQDETGKTLTRDQLAHRIHQKLIKEGDLLHTLYTKNAIMQMDAESTVSGFFAHQMNKQVFVIKDPNGQ